jgi:hypothetical protein
MRKLYGAPKTYKPGKKMRPIVSNIDAPTKKIAKWLAEEFNKFPDPPDLYVKNTPAALKKLEGAHS